MGMVVQKLDGIDEKLDSIGVEVKLNSEFRIQSKTIIGVVAFIFTVFGASICWVVSKMNS